MSSIFPLCGFDPQKEAMRLSFTTLGTGTPIILLSGFPQTKHSWDHILPLLSMEYCVYAIDLPGIGESPILNVPYNTRNCTEIFHHFLTEKKLGKVHVVAHDIGAWIGFTWAAMYPTDFRSLTLIDAGIPGITLKETVNLNEVTQRWHFFFQMMQDDLAEKMILGKEHIYYDWWFTHKVRNSLSISKESRKAYIQAYSRPGRTKAVLRYYQAILEDININKALIKSLIPVPTLGIGGEYGSIPQMGETLKDFFTHVEGITIKDSGHYVPEEQAETFLEALILFLNKFDE